MARVNQVAIEGFKSIEHQIVLKFPSNKPIVLIGENNSGKSNIVRAVDFIFGEYHPKYQDLDDHDYFDRNPENTIVIEVEVSGYMNKLGRTGEFNCSGFRYENDHNAGEPRFCAIQDDGNDNNFVSNELRKELTSIIVTADQNLAYQLSYTSKYTLLSKVMKAFHKELISNEERVGKLKELYEDIKKIFLSVPEFCQFKDDMSSIAGKILANMTYSLDLDFSAYDPSNYFKSLRVNPSEEGNARNFEELGTGQQQLLALSFAHAYSKSFLEGNLILIIDEPESHLHPLAQKWLARVINKLAQDGLQIILTTHSPHFINLEFIDGINLIRKSGGSTQLIQHDRYTLYNHCLDTGANSNKITEENVVPFYANQATPHILKGFFARKIILVEGPTEELALPELFKKIDFDLTENGVEVIGVSGKGNLAKWWRLFTLYEIPTYVCFDNDSKSDKDQSGNKRRDALKAIGIADAKIEEVLSSKNWNINEKFCVFGVDYENTMRNSFSKYSEIEEIKKEQLGSASKHIIARETAKALTKNDDEGWGCLEEMVSRIK